MKTMNQKNTFKSFLCVVLVIVFMATLLSATVLAATDWKFTLPGEPMAVENTDGTRYLTTTAQRAGSEIPLILGLNAVATNINQGDSALWGAGRYVAGTNVNTNPDPYIWNYNFMKNTEVSEALRKLEDNEYMYAVNDTNTNSSGLFDSGGANQIIDAAHDEWGGVSIGIHNRVDIFLGYSDKLMSQINLINNLPGTSEYYQEGDEDYSPMFLDVQTGSLASRAYAWTDMAKVINKYLSESDGTLAVRYGDPLVTATNLEEASFGITYYIRSLIDKGLIHKKKAAFVTASADGVYTAKDPITMGDVKSDCFAVGNIFDWQTGNFTIADMADFDLIVICDSQGYSYTGGAPGGSTNPVTNKATFLAALDALGGTGKVPMVFETSKCITLGNNGFNYSPITPTFVPYIHAYLYMDELASVNNAINPVAMIRFVLEKLYHVKSSETENVALYYIGSNWDSVDEDLDQVPPTTGYTYNTGKIESAIKDGIRYALNNANNPDTYMLPAYRITDNIYKVATGQKTWEEALSPTYLSQYSASELDEMLEAYEAHMVSHPWQPDTSVAGTYGYGLTGNGNPGPSGSGGGGGGGGGGGSGTVAAVNHAPAANTVTATTSVTAATDTSGSGKASAGVTAAQLSAAISEATANAAVKGADVRPAIEIKVGAPTGTKTVATNVPAAAISQAAKGEIQSMTISSSIAAVTFDQKTLAGIADTAAGDVNITAGNVDVATLPSSIQNQVGDHPVYNFSVTSGGSSISNFDGSVTVEIPYKLASGEDDNNVVIYYLNAGGALEIVKDCVYDPATGNVVFKTTHFSTYAVGYNKVSFTDVSGWYAAYVSYLSARGVITGSGDGKFSPSANITRAEFAQILANMSGDDLSSYTGTSFPDVEAAAWYGPAVAWAYGKGIVQGTDGKYNPNAYMTRQDIALMLGRYTEKIAGTTLTATEDEVSFADGSSISGYARDAVSAMQQAGVIAGYSDNTFKPQANATRAEISKMIAVLLQSMIR